MNETNFNIDIDTCLSYFTNTILKSIEQFILFRSYLSHPIYYIFINMRKHFII